MFEEENPSPENYIDNINYEYLLPLSLMYPGLSNLNRQNIFFLFLIKEKCATSLSLYFELY